MKKLFFLLPILLLASGCNLSAKLGFSHKANAPTPTPAAFQTYTNAKYGYSFAYPKDWYVDDISANDELFCNSEEPTKCYGGIIYVSNYANYTTYVANESGETAPAPKDVAAVAILPIPAGSDMRSDPKTFCRDPAQTNAQISNITINGLNGQTCTAYQTSFPTGNIKITYITGKTYEFAFGYVPKDFKAFSASDVQKMEAIINSFKAQ